MKFKPVYLLLCLLVLTSVSQARFNVWEPEDGVQIRQGHHIGWNDQSTACDDEGNWCITWSDGHMGQHNVYAQLYDASGNPQWGDSPLLIAEGPWVQMNSKVYHSSDNSWIFVWEDYRFDAAKEVRPVSFVQKVSDAGTFVWQDQGLPLFTNAVTSFYSESYPDDDGGLFHVCHHYPDGIRIQRVDSNGSQLWGMDGLLTESISGYFRATVYNGDLIIINWYNSNGSTGNINRYNINGEAQWGAGIEISFDSYISGQPKLIAQDGGNIFLVWKELHSNNLYAMSIDENGTIAGDGAEAIVSNAHYFLARSLFLTDENQFKVVYETESNDLRYQEVTFIDNAFQRTHPLTGQAVISELNFVNYSAWNDPNGGFFLAYQAREEYTPNDYSSLYHIENDGSLTWDDPLDFSMYNHPILCLLATGDNTVLVKHDYQGETVGLYFDHLDTETGQLVNNPDPDNFSHTVVSGFQFNTHHHNILKSADHVYSAWVDRRNQMQELPYVQKSNYASGETQWQHAGIPVVNITDDQFAMHGYQLKIIKDNSGGIFTIFVSNENNDEGEYIQHCRLQHITENGELTWGDLGVTVFDEAQPELDYPENHFTFLNSENEVCVIFNAVNENWGRELVYQKFSSTGERLCGDQGIHLTPDFNGECEVVNVIQHGDVFHILYIENNLTDPYLRIMAIDSDGQELWDNPTTFGIHHDRNSYLCNAVKVGDHTAVVWEQYDMGSRTATLYSNVIDLNGNKINDTLPIDIDHINGHIYRLNLAQADDNSFWLSYLRNYNQEILLDRVGLNLTSQLDYRFMVPVENYEENSVSELALIPDLEHGINVVWIESGGVFCENDIYHHHFTFEGNSADDAYGDFGLPVCEAWYAQDRMATVPDGEGGFLITWIDYRGSQVMMEEDDVYIMRINDFTTDVKPSAQSNIPVNWALLPAYPNPFNPSTSIMYHVGNNANVELTVYDLLGREVANLVNDHKFAGQYSITWNGKDSRGYTVASGTYFYRLKADNVNLTRSMILLK